MVAPLSPPHLSPSSGCQCLPLLPFVLLLMHTGELYSGTYKITLLVLLTLLPAGHAWNLNTVKTVTAFLQPLSLFYRPHGHCKLCLIRRWPLQALPNQAMPFASLPYQYLANCRTLLLSSKKLQRQASQQETHSDLKSRRTCPQEYLLRLLLLTATPVHPAH